MINNIPSPFQIKCYFLATGVSEILSPYAWGVHVTSDI